MPDLFLTKVFDAAGALAGGGVCRGPRASWEAAAAVEADHVATGRLGRLLRCSWDGVVRDAVYEFGRVLTERQPE